SSMWREVNDRAALPTCAPTTPHKPGSPTTPAGRTGRAPCPPLDEHGIAELVRAVAAGLQLPVGPAERRLVRERAQQFVMAAAGLVRAREDGIDDAQPAGRAEALRRHALRARARTAFPNPPLHSTSARAAPHSAG